MIGTNLWLRNVSTESLLYSAYLDQRDDFLGPEAVPKKTVFTVQSNLDDRYGRTVVPVIEMYRL